MHEPKLHIVQKPADKFDYDKRQREIVLHFTVGLYAKALWELRHGGVSAHYLVPPQDGSAQLQVDQIVDINDRAWHAGVSAWKGRTNLNDTSLGIEIVNRGIGFVQPNGSVLYSNDVEKVIEKKLIGYMQKHDAELLERIEEHELWQVFFYDMMTQNIAPAKQELYNAIVSPLVQKQYQTITMQIREKIHDPFLNINVNELYHLEREGKLVWDKFSDAQIDAVIVLCKKIIQDTQIVDEKGEIIYQIPATAIVGHADIAPGRKQDPGPNFPWKRLAEHGIGAWPNAEALESAHQFCQKLDSTNMQIDIAWLQQALSIYGYQVEITKVFDQQTRDAIISFQMHFYPENYSGIPDNGTCAMLIGLLDTYFSGQYPEPTIVSKENKSYQTDMQYCSKHTLLTPAAKTAPQPDTSVKALCS